MSQENDDKPALPEGYAPGHKASEDAEFKGEAWAVKNKNGRPAKPGSPAAMARAREFEVNMTPLGPRDLFDDEMRSRFARVGLALGIPNENNALDWANKWTRKLLPEAIANLAEALRSPDQAVRWKASERVLAMNGIDKKEAAVSGGQSTIVIQVNNKDVNTDLPWLQRKDKREGGKE